MEERYAKLLSEQMNLFLRSISDLEELSNKEFLERIQDIKKSLIYLMAFYENIEDLLGLKEGDGETATFENWLDVVYNEMSYEFFMRFGKRYSEDVAHMRTNHALSDFVVYDEELVNRASINILAVDKKHLETEEEIISYLDSKLLEMDKKNLSKKK